jgi:hypothetical protein
MTLVSEIDSPTWRFITSPSQRYPGKGRASLDLFGSLDVCSVGRGGQQTWTIVDEDAQQFNCPAKPRAPLSHNAVS